MFFEHSESFTESFSSFQRYPSISDRDAWNSLDETWKQETIALGEQYLNFSYLPLSATDFMEFNRTGNRTNYEKKCFEKRHALNALVLAECVENQGRFMDNIMNGIFSICEESAWQLPAHNTYVRDTPQHILPDSTTPVLDLFACETGSILATVFFLLKEKLDTVSPFICKRIMHELNHRIFTSYLNAHFWWMGNGKEPMNNWTIWCTQNVLLSVFLSDTDNNLREKVLKKACQSIDYFLAEYGDDGCCDEGANYYRHAGLCLFNSIDILNAVTSGFFESMYEEIKIKNIASYILHAHIEDEYYVNFADCSPVAGRAGVREFLFATYTNNTEMMIFAATDYLKGSRDALLLPNENNLYYRLQNGFTASKIREYAQVYQNTTITHSDYYYPSVGLFIARDDHLYLAVKAGDNDDSHNHNDTGSIIVYKDGKPLLIDIGVESYTKKTFSPQRYEIWTMQSDYHNLPTLNGFMQQNGPDYKATNVNYKFHPDICEISMDIAAAYPKECGITSYIRKAVLQKDTQITITDQYTSDENATVTLHFMTYEKPTPIVDSDYLTIQIGQLGSLTLSHVMLDGIEEFPISDARLMQTWKHPIYRINVTLTSNTVIASIK
ncbi:MAG: heparinase [Lachnospiraceae bacterium]|nr:heparinase [Lachnospiraceae bacterium]